MILTKEYQSDVKKALRAAKAGSAYHWPTVAAILADEVERLYAEQARMKKEIENERRT